MDAPLLAAAFVLAAIVALWFVARRAITICVIEVEQGRARLASGQIAPRILADLDDVTRRAAVDRATVRVVRSDGRASVELHGAMSAACAQQLRNVIGSVPLASLANGRRKA